MGRAVWISLAVLLAGAGAAGFYWYQRQVVAPPEAVSADPGAEPDEEAPPEIQHPLPERDADDDARPLPALNESDDAVRGSLEDLFGASALEKYLVPERIVHNAVATIDSLDRKPVPLRVRPIAYVPGLVVTDVRGDVITLSSKNAERYGPLIAVLQAADAPKLAEFYLHFYPLFQQAYVDLGYPDRYFNDRLIQVIDHLLEAPSVKEPIRLVRPKVLYQFADEDLEARSSGQKALVRIGPANAGIVKGKLREIRAVIAAQP